MTIMVRRGSFLIVLVVVVALALPARKAIDDGKRRFRRSLTLPLPPTVVQKSLYWTG
jgi:hypothetical protein